jgi:hypothetical protein
MEIPKATKIHSGDTTNGHPWSWRARKLPHPKRDPDQDSSSVTDTSMMFIIPMPWVDSV